MITPYSNEGNQHKKRKPVLRLKILNELCIHDKLSKSQFQKLFNQHHYKEVSQSFDILGKMGYIEKAGQNKGKGQPEKFYRITENGLEALFDKNITPERFWVLITSYCLKSTDPIRPELINEMFRSFLKKYLKYSSGFSSIVNIDQINDMCTNWLSNNPHNGIGSKIIETLASYPLLNINDLTLILKCSRAVVHRELGNISMTEGGGGYLHPLEEYDVQFSNHGRYLDMLQRCIVIYRTDISNKTIVYELSLVGIIMYLTLVRHRDSPQMLISACNKIGHNYRDRRVLPLIFGKWSMLKKMLGPMGAYNFEVLLNKEARKGSTSLSVIMGGINEFYENMKSIIHYNIEETKKIYDEGEYLIESAIRKNKSKPKNIADIERKLQEVSLLSRYDDLARLQFGLTNTTDARYPQPEMVVKILCDAFSEEITFLFYFILYERYYFSRLLSSLYYLSSHKSLIYYHIKESHKSEKGQDSSSSSLVERLQRTSSDTFSRRKLIQILKGDNEIREWFHVWLTDIYKFQNAASDVISKLEL